MMMMMIMVTVVITVIIGCESLETSLSNSLFHGSNWWFIDLLCTIFLEKFFVFSHLP